MTKTILAAATGLALVLATPGWAQTTTTTTTIPTGNFDSLSPGNQKIANALFAAQNTTGTPLTKDQIAGLKGTEGWGRVFKQMKAEGLISAKNLGQVVSGHEHSLHAGTATTTTTTATRSGRSATSRHGRMSTASAAHGHFRGGNGRFASTGGFARGGHMSHGFAAGSMGGGFGHGGFGGGMGGGMGHGGGGGGGHGR